MEEIRYYKDGGKICRLSVKQDCDPLEPYMLDDEGSPRLMCWHRHYNLGHHKENHYQYPDYFLNDLLEQHYTDEEIIQMATEGRFEDITLTYSEEEEAWGMSTKTDIGSFCYEGWDEQLFDDLLDVISMQDKIKLLEAKDMLFLPLSLYDHSGISMYIGSPLDHFDGRWDCSRIGWVYTSLGQIYKYWDSSITAENWREYAEKICEDTVKTYNMYLAGEVYMVSLEYFDFDTQDWNTPETYGDFYSDNYGDKLMNEIAEECGIKSPLYDTLEDLIAA